MLPVLMLGGSWLDIVRDGAKFIPHNPWLLTTGLLLLLVCCHRLAVLLSARRAAGKPSSVACRQLSGSKPPPAMVQVAVQAFCCGSTAGRHLQGPCCCADVGEEQDQANPGADLFATTACLELPVSCGSGSSSGRPGSDSCSSRRSSVKGSPCRSSLHPLQHATTRMPALQDKVRTGSSTEPCRRSSCCSPASGAATRLAGRLDAATKHCTGPEAPQQAVQADLCRAASSGGLHGSAAPVHATQGVACTQKAAAAELDVPEVSTSADCSAEPGIEPTPPTTESIAAQAAAAPEAAAAAQPAAAAAPSAEDYAAVARAAAAEGTQQVLCCAEQEVGSDVCCRVSVKQSKALRVSFAPLPPSKDLWLQQLRSMPPEGKARFMRKLQLVGRKAWCMWRRRSRTPTQEQQQQEEERHGLKRDWQRAASESSSDEDELLQGSPCKKALAPGLEAAGGGPEPKGDRSGFGSPVAGVSVWGRDAAVGSPQPMVLG